MRGQSPFLLGVNWAGDFTVKCRIILATMSTPQYQSYGSSTPGGRDRTDLTAIVTATPKVVFKVPDSPASAQAR